MSTKLLEIANKIASKLGLEDDSLTKIAAGNKTKMSRKQMVKQLEKSKNKYKQLKDVCDVMEAEDQKLKTKLEDFRKNLTSERKAILRMHEAMEKMDLADVNDAMFYDDDIAYVMDGKEYHLEIDSDANIKLTPMSKYRKEMKKEEEYKKNEKRDDDEAHDAETCINDACDMCMVDDDWMEAIKAAELE